jgi:Protein of unknown function (DUF1838)
MMKLIGTAVLLMSAVTAQAKTLDLNVGADAITAFRKIQCSTVDNQPSFYHWSGTTYARVAGEPDRALFRVEGMNVRQCVTVNDPQRGKGMRQVSREVMLYVDLKTGEPLRSFANPWTGKTNDVIQVSNDPVNMRGAMFPVDAKGEKYDLGGRTDGGKFFQNIEVPLFYPNPLGGDYQTAVGNQYHAMEMFNFIVDEKDLLDASKPAAMSTVVSWVRIAPWLPWMDMGSRDGLMVTNATGRKLATFEELPEVLKKEIKANYASYVAPPPGDDKRPNETSWTYYKKLMDAKKAAK